MNWKTLTLATLAAIFVCSCGTKSYKMEITKSNFGQLNGKEIDAYTLTNNQGMKVKITNYGGAIVELWVPDKNGELGDITFGFDSVAGYRSDAFLKVNPFFGALIGRYGNRIDNAKFTLNGKEYKLSANDGKNSLHGGAVGFDKVVWNAEKAETENAIGLKLTCFSKDGDQGYPGNLDVEVYYWLTNDNELKIQYSAGTDKPTHCNLTNHAYFDLSAGMAKDAMDHELMILANKYTEIRSDLIPTGDLPDVEGTPMDFRTSQRIGSRINDDFKQLERAGGYDHNWVLSKYDGKLNLAATLSEPISGRVMEVYTTEPGIQFYAGNFLNETLVGKGNRVYGKRSGICLETQHFPDSPNQKKFPSTVLNPSQEYKSETVYKFLTK